eukprot:3882680-Pleurochrysis_carterae.AAC.1
MDLPVCPAYMEMTSLMVETRSRTGPGAGMAMWRTWALALPSESPTRSTSCGDCRMYFGATRRTHEGSVAEKRHVCRDACVHSPRMADMSSAKPMSSIWRQTRMQHMRIEEWVAREGSCSSGGIDRQRGERALRVG